MRNVLAAAGVLVLVGAGTEWAAGPATGGIPRKEPAGHFRAMSPQRDSDDCYGAGVAVPAGLSVGKRGAVLDTDRDRVRAELAARLGINFRVRSPSFVLQLRPEALPPMSQKPANDTVGGGDVDIELVGELSGDMDELCERFLKHAEVMFRAVARGAPCLRTPDTLLSLGPCRFACSLRRSTKGACVLPTTLLRHTWPPPHRATVATSPCAFCQNRRAHNHDSD